MCSHSFARLLYLRNHHLSTYSSVGTFSCEICGVKFKTMDVLWQHKKSHHALGLVPDQPAQVGRPVQDQRSTVAHLGMEQKPVSDHRFNSPVSDGLEQQMHFSKAVIPYFI